MASPKVSNLLHDVSRDELLGLNHNSERVKLADYSADVSHARAKIQQASQQRASVSAQLKQQMPAAAVDAKIKSTSSVQSHGFFSKVLEKVRPVAPKPEQAADVSPEQKTRRKP